MTSVDTVACCLYIPECPVNVAWVYLGQKVNFGVGSESMTALLFVVIDLKNQMDNQKYA